MQSFFSAISAYTKAFRIISEMRLWRYFFIPGLISILLGSAIITLAFLLSDNLGGWLASWYPFERGSVVVSTLSSILSGAMIFAGGLIIYKHLVMILASPFMTPLAQQVEDKLRGQIPKRAGFSPQQAAKDMLRGLRLSLRNITRELIFTAFLLLANLIPGIGSLFSAVGIFMVQSFYAGFGNLDYLLERHYNVAESIDFVKHHRGLALGNGAIFMLLLMTGVGFLIAPPLATVAATIAASKSLGPLN